MCIHLFVNRWYVEMNKNKNSSTARYGKFRICFLVHRNLMNDRIEFSKKKINHISTKDFWYWKSPGITGTRMPKNDFIVMFSEKLRNDHSWIWMKSKYTVVRSIIGPIEWTCYSKFFLINLFKSIEIIRPDYIQKSWSV